MPKRPTPPRTKPKLGAECPVHHLPTLRWPDGTVRCPADHSTAKDIIKANETRRK